MDDFVINVRQIGQYPPAGLPTTNDLVLIQQGGLGGPYMTLTPSQLVGTALQTVPKTFLGVPVDGGLYWGTPGSDVGNLTLEGGYITASVGFYAPTLLARTAIVNNDTVAGQTWVSEQIATQFNAIKNNSVFSFNGRRGDVFLTCEDVYSALQLFEPIATQDWVNQTICMAVPQFLYNQPLVYTWNGRVGDVFLTLADVECAFFSCPGIYPTAPSPPLGDASKRIATTAFVDESLVDLYGQIQTDLDQIIDLSSYAPLASPDFTGVPTAPTANPGTTTGQLATTAYVMNAVAASTAGVASFNTRTGAVTLTTADVTNAGGAPIASPAFTGTPSAPTATTGTSTTQLATTAFVHAVVAGVSVGVASFNGRTGVVTLTTADVTGAGGAPIASPAFTGTPSAPTAAQTVNDTTIASTAYVRAAIAALPTSVASFNGRTGAVTLQANDVSAVGGAMINSPAFTGTPSAPTPPNGTSNQQLATTAFVMNEIAATAAGVTSFNTRTGAVTLITADITGAGGAPIASPAFTGTPSAPTAAQTVNDTTIATTAYVRAAIAAQTLVASFNGRTGAVSLQAADVSAAGGALTASPTFSGTPSAPTAAPGTSTTQLATTAFVTAAVAAGVTSFNGRNGAVTLSTADITGAGGAPLASPAFTGTPSAPTQTTGTNNTTLATTAFVQNSISAMTAGVTSFNTRTGAVTFQNADLPANVSISGTLDATGVLTAHSSLHVIGAPIFDSTINSGQNGIIFSAVSSPAYRLHPQFLGIPNVMVDNNGSQYGMVVLGVDVSGGGIGVANFGVNGAASSGGIRWNDAGGAATFPITYSSDRAFKRNIHPVERDALADLCKLGVYDADILSLNNDDTTQHWEYSLMSDEVAAVNPCGCIPAEGEHGRDILHPLPLIAMLIKAIQQLVDRVAALEAA